MKTKAVRLYGKNDLRFEEFGLPDIKQDEMLAHITTDALCMSSYKAAIQGTDHKRIPPNIASEPVIVGHEMCGTIVKVGSKWKHAFASGDYFSVQPSFNYNGSFYAPGYSYKYMGGDATYVILPKEAMETNSVLKYNSDIFFLGSLAEPLSCVIRAFHSFYHIKQGEYIHKMGTAENGRMALLGGAGPLGLGAIDYALNNDRRPSLLVVTDIDQARLDRARRVYTQKNAAEHGVDLHIINANTLDVEKEMISLTGGAGFDDILVMIPRREVAEQADHLLAHDGCLHFFAGPTSKDFSASVNYYNVHYASTHIIGSSGGNSQDVQEALDMIAQKRLNPAAMVTHIGGLNCVAEATLNLPKLGYGKILIYTNIRMDLTAIADLKTFGKNNAVLYELGRIIEKHEGLWNADAERFLLEHGEKI